MPLPGIHDPLDADVGRVVRILRALPPGPAPAEARDAVLTFVRSVNTVAADDEDGTAGSLRERFIAFGGATLASVVAAVVFDATHVDAVDVGAARSSVNLSSTNQQHREAILGALAGLRTTLAGPPSTST